MFCFKFSFTVKLASFQCFSNSSLADVISNENSSFCMLIRLIGTLCSRKIRILVTVHFFQPLFNTSD